MTDAPGATATPAPRVGRLLVALAFLSGVAALLFETLWFRVTGLVFGNGIWASSVVLSAFMAGLALGNGLAARVGDRASRPLRLYAALELAIGLGGAALVFGLPPLTDALAPVLARFVDTPWLLNALRLVLGFGLLMIPATAMGATLPVIVKALSREDVRFGAVLGRLYGWNTLGAVVGSLLGEAALIGWFGLRGSALCAAALNGVVALLALQLARGRAPLAATMPRARTPRFGLIGARLLLGAFLSGGAFLALEVVWFRFLSLFVYGTSLVFAVMLAVVLVGISLGGLAAARWVGRGGGAAGALPALALLSAVLVPVGFATYQGVLRALLAPGHAAAATLHVVLITVPLVLPVAFLSGVLFTAVGDVAKAQFGAEARTTGLVTLANTLGAALGSLVGGFVLLPGLGIEGALLALAASYVVLAGVLAVPAPGRSRRLQVVTAALAAGVVVAWVTFPHGVLRRVYLPHPTEAFLEPGSRVAAVREGLLNTLVYVRTDRLGQPLYYRMFTDGFSMSATTFHSKRYMKAYVYLPVALKPDLRSAVLISYGVGSTAKALTDTASLETIDIVDISPEILETSRIVFPTPSEDPLRDPRVTVHVEDGRFFLQTSERRFDLITSEPPPPKYAGIVNLYSREYFSLIRERLADGGITTYWLPVHNLTEADALAITRAFCDVFDDCTLWTGAGLDWMLVGTRGGIPAPSADAFARQWRDPVVGPELRALGFERPEQLGATFLAGTESLRALTRDTAPLVDDFPHRLSTTAVTPMDAHRSQLFGRLMDVEAARRAFEDSDFVARSWPASLREATLPWFRWQAVVNARLVYDGGTGAGQRDLHAVLAETDLQTLPLWLLGSEARERDLALRADAGAGATAELLRARGVARLAERDYAAAAGWFRRARGAERGAQLLLLETYARCMAGERAEAQRLAQGLLRGPLAGPGNADTRRWLGEVCALPELAAQSAEGGS